MARKFYKTIIQVEVLSEDNPIGDYVDLADLAYEITDGECSGNVEVKEKIELTGKQAADALENQGSDPSFFRLDDDGNDVED